MKDMQNTAIDDATVKDIVIGACGALSMFSITRFFKNSDSTKERLRNLESFKREMELFRDQLNSDHETINNKLSGLSDHSKKTDIKLVNLDRDIKAVNKDVRHTNNNVKMVRDLMHDLLKDKDK
jgi:hypothetical protein